MTEAEKTRLRRFLFYRWFFGASVDADAGLQQSRVVADGGQITDVSFVSNLITSLKAGPGNCYTALSGLWIAQAVKMDGSNNVSKIYDMSPAKGATYYDASVTGTAQVWQDNVLDGKPAIMFASAGCYSTPAISSLAQPGSIFLLCRKDGGGVGLRVVFDSVTGRWLVRYAANTTSIDYFAGNVLTIATAQATFGQFTATLNGASSTLRRKGSQISTGDAGAIACSGVARLGGANNGIQDFMVGPVCLWAIATGLTTGQRDYIEGVINGLFPSSA